MSVSAMTLNSTLVIKYQTGTSPFGAPEIRQKTFNDVRADATKEDIYAVAEALFSLVKHPIVHVYLRENSELIKD